MGAAFGNAAVLQDENQIRVPHGGNPLGDDKLRAGEGQGTELTLNVLLGFAVHGGGGVVHDQNVGTDGQGPGQGDALALEK